MLNIKDLSEIYKLRIANPSLSDEELEGKIPRSLLGNIGKGIQAGINQIGQAGYTAAQMAGNLTGIESLEKFGESGYEQSTQESKRFAPSPDIGKDILDNPKQLLDLSYWAYNIPQVATSMLPSLFAGGLVGKGVQILGRTFKLTPTLIAKLARISGITAGGAIGGGQEGTQTFQDLKKLGVSDEDATKGMVVMTAASAALNALSLKTMTKGVPSGAVKKIAHWLGAGTVEAGGEWGEEPVDALLKLNLAPDKFSKEDFKKQMRSSVNVIPSSFVMGGGGAVVSDFARTGMGILGEGMAKAGENIFDRETERLQNLPTEPAITTKPTITKESLLTPDGAMEYAKTNPDIVDNLLNVPEGVEAASRKRFGMLGTIGENLNKGERRRILDLLRAAKEELAKSAMPTTKEGDINVSEQTQGEGEKVAKAPRLKNALLTPRGAAEFLRKHPDKADYILNSANNQEAARGMFKNVFQDDKEIYDFLENLWTAKEKQNNPQEFQAFREKLQNSGLKIFDPQNPDAGDLAVVTLTLSDGSIVYDPQARHHGKLAMTLEDAGIDLENVVEKGFIIDNIYKKSSIQPFKETQAFKEEPIDADAEAANKHLDDYLEEASLIDDMFNAVNLEENIGETQPFKETSGQQPPPEIQQAPAGPVAYSITDIDIGNQKPISPLDAIKSIVTAFNLPALRDVKRFPRSLNKALAVYFKREHVADILKKEKNAIGAVIHEVGHHIDNIHKIIASIPAQLKSEVANLDYDPEKKRLDEGFAEFFRAYMMQDDRSTPNGVNKAEALAPNFFRYFENTLLPNNPELAKAVKDIQPLIQRLRFQGREKYLKSSITKNNKSSPWDLNLSIYDNLVNLSARAFERLYYLFVNDGNYIDLFTKAAIENGAVFKPGASPIQNFYGAMRAAAGFAQYAITNEVVDFATGRKIGPALSEVFAGLETSQIDELEMMAVSRHVLDEYRTAEAPQQQNETDEQYKKRIEAGTNTGITKETAQYNYDHFNNLHPDWNQRLDKFTAYHKALVFVLGNAEVISKESMMRIIRSKKMYVPLMRASDQFSDRKTGRKRLINLSSPIKGRKGSVEKIYSPFQATLEMTQRFYMRAAQQKILTSIYDACIGTEGMGGWMHEVLPDMKKITFPAEDVAAQLKKLGVDEAALGVLKADDVLYLWRPDYYVNRDNEFVGRIQMPDGKQKLFAFEPHLFRSLYALDSWQVPWFLDMFLGKITRFVKFGATGISMAFQGPNVFRDMFTAPMQKERSATLQRGLAATTKDPLYFAAAYLHTLTMHKLGKKGDPFVELYIKHGGAQGHFLQMDNASMRHAIEYAARDTATKKAMGIIRHPIEAAREGVFSTLEAAPRIAILKDKLLERGWDAERLKKETPPMDVVQEAIIASMEVTVNFTRSGAWMRPISQIGLAGAYVNPAIQGIDKFFRTWKNDPTRTALAVATLSTAYIGYWAMRKDDDDYDEYQPWLKYGFLTFAPWRIPIPREWGMTAMAPVAFFESLRKEEKDELWKYLKQTAGTFNPLGKPVLTAPFSVWGFNKDPYILSKDVVPPELEAGSGRNQYDEKTSRLLVEIGNLFNWSPMKLEKVLDSMMGGIVSEYLKPLEKIVLREAMTTSDIAFVKRLRIDKDYSQTTQEIYDEKNRLKKLATDEANKRGTMKPEDKLRYEELRFAESTMSELRRLGITLEADAASKVLVDKYLIGMAREIMGEEPRMRYPNFIKADAQSMPAEIRDVRTKMLGGLLTRIGNPDSDPNTTNKEKRAELKTARIEDRNEAIALWKKLGLPDAEAKTIYKDYQVLLHKDSKSKNFYTANYYERQGRIQKALTQKS